jgi:hypothetical protein
MVWLCPFQYLLSWTPYLTLYAHVSLAQKQIPTQNTLWHFTPKGRLFILMLLLLHCGWPSNLKSIPSTQLEEGPPPCITWSSKTILPLYYLGRTWTFSISNYFRSNFVSSPMELDSNKANKKGSKETNPIGRVCEKVVYWRWVLWRTVTRIVHIQWLSSTLFIWYNASKT